MKKTSLYLAGLAAGAMFTGCLFQGQETGADAARAQFEVKAVAGTGALAMRSAADSEMSITDASGFHFTVQEARAYIGRIELRSVKAQDTCASSDGNDSNAAAAKACGDNGELSVNGHFAVNLLTGESMPAMGTLSVPAGTYREIEVRLQTAKIEDGVLAAGDELLGHSLIVKGTFGLAGQAEKPFTLALDIHEKIEIEKAEGITLDASALNTILVSLKADEWLTGLNVKTCLSGMDTTQTVVFSEDNDLGKCLNLEGTVKANVEKSFEVEEHKGDDGDRHGGRDSGKADTSRSGETRDSGKGDDHKADSSKSGDGKMDSSKSGDNKSGDGKTDTSKSGGTHSGDGKIDSSKTGNGKVDSSKSGDGKVDSSKSGDVKADSGKGDVKDTSMASGKNDSTKTVAPTTSGDGKVDSTKSGDVPHDGSTQTTTTTTTTSGDHSGSGNTSGSGKSGGGSVTGTVTDGTSSGSGDAVTTTM